MDKIYTNPDVIPSDYVFGEITDNYITLYNKPSFHNETATYYRIYYKYSSDLVVSGTQTFGQYYSVTYPRLPISHDVQDRPDFVNILVITLIFSVFRSLVP